MNMDIEYSGKRDFKVKVRGHEIKMDLPERLGGDDTAPTPTECFMASLGACACLFAVRYMETAKLDPNGLAMKMDWEFNEEKTGIKRISMCFSVPNAVLGARKNALIKAAEQCVLHNSLRDHPDMEISVEGE